MYVIIFFILTINVLNIFIKYNNNGKRDKRDERDERDERDKRSKVGFVLSGEEFNEIYKDNTFYKFLNNNFCHRGYQYCIGLNIDTVPFNPTKWISIAVSS